MSSKKSERFTFFENREKRHLGTKTFELPRATKFLPYFCIITVATRKQLVALIRVPDLSGLQRSIKFCNLKKSIFFDFEKKFIAIFLFRRSATPASRVLMGYALSAYTIYAPNPQTRTSQPLT